MKENMKTLSKLYRDNVSFESEELFRFGHTESFIWIGISITATLMYVIVFIYSKGDAGIFFH